jgi:hypothetical protein
MTGEAFVCMMHNLHRPIFTICCRFSVGLM